MEEIVFAIDSKEVRCKKGDLVLIASQRAGIYIPALCFHPALDLSNQIKPDEFIYRADQRIKGDGLINAFEECGLCMVEIEKEGLFLACHTTAREGMVVHTNTAQVQALRQQRLAEILLYHPHECLICDQGEGCIPFQASCPRDVLPKERCCPRYGNCEFEKIVKYVGIKTGIGRFTYPDVPILSDNPFFEQNYNLCIGCLRCVRVCKDLIGVGALGFVSMNRKVVVGTVEPSLGESGCKFCGCCVEVCPTGALIDKGVFRVEREKILLPCQNTCPLMMDVPRYVDYISRGEFEKALAVIYEKTPFSAVLGRVCPHPCEDNCRRGQMDEPIAICDLKRFVADKIERKLPPKQMERSEKVAIIGSGPAGLSAAFYLSLKGYQITVFEKLPVPGGMMRTGIPEYRLTRIVLDMEIESIRSLGVEIKTNTLIGDGLSIRNLLSQGFKAIFIATGASKDLKLNIPGEDSRGVIPGVSFLERVNSGQKPSIGERTVVVGGGNAAIDAARSALRVGSREVTVLYRRSRDEMPASHEEIEEALAEGVKVEYLVAPTKIISKGKNGIEVSCTRMRLGEPDITGRRRPIPISGSEFLIEFDTVISAIGQAPDLSFISRETGIEETKSGLLKVSPDTLQTSREGIFAGGDAVTGPGLVVDAIEMGRKGAASIDKYLGGTGVIGDVEDADAPMKKAEPLQWIGWEEGFADKFRRKPASVAVEERVRNFKEIRMCFEEKKAVEEAKRCLKCYFRFQIPKVMLPPEKWVVFNEENVKNVPDNIEGVVELLDEEKNIIYILGTDNIRSELEDFLDLDDPLMEKVRYFVYEETSLFTTRQNELIQTYLQAHGSLPEGNEQF